MVSSRKPSEKANTPKTSTTSRSCDDTASGLANGSATAYYWLCAGKRYGDVRDLDRTVREETPARILSRTGSLWYTWVNKTGEDLSDLPEEIIELYRRSLLVVKTQCDHDGGIVAATDSDIEWGHNDHYSYLAARRGAGRRRHGPRRLSDEARRFLPRSRHLSNDGISAQVTSGRRSRAVGSPCCATA